MEMELSSVHKEPLTSQTKTVHSSIFPAVPHVPIYQPRQELSSVDTSTQPTSSTLPDSIFGRDSGYGSSNRSTNSPSEFTVRRGKFIRRKQKVQEIVGPIGEAAKRRFIDLREEFFSRDFIRYLDCDRNQIAKLSIKPKLLGRNEEDASLYIVILCERSLIKKIQRYCSRSELKKELEAKKNTHCPSFHLHVCPLPPEFIAADFGCEVERQADSIVQSTTLCGAVVRASSTTGDHVATIGGLVKLSFGDRFEIFAMTANHLTTPKPEKKSAATLEELVTRYTLVDKEEPSDGYHDSWSGDTEVVLADEGSFDDQSFYPCINEICDQRSTCVWRQFGIVWNANNLGPEDLDLDWSLITISDTKAILPNLDLSRSCEPRCENKFSVFEQAAADTEGEKRCFLLDSSLKRRRGTLSVSSVYIYLGRGEDMTSVFTLKMDNPKDLRPGDSGTWIVNEKTDEVFGYVVAVDLFQDAYVMPLSAAFAQIASKLKASSVSLPSPHEVEVYRDRISNQATKDDPYSPTHPHLSGMIAAAGGDYTDRSATPGELPLNTSSGQEISRPKSFLRSDTRICQLSLYPDQCKQTLKQESGGYLDMSRFSTWLNDQDNTKSSMKVLVIAGQISTDRQEEVRILQSLFQDVKLPKKALEMHIKSKSSFVSYESDWYTPSDLYDGRTYHCGNGSQTFVWSFDPTTSSTRGILLCSSTTDTGIIDRFYHRASELLDKTYHPMLIAYLTAEISVTDVSDQIDSLAGAISCLEFSIEDTGQELLNHATQRPNGREHTQLTLLRMVDEIDNLAAELAAARSQARWCPSQLSWVDACNRRYVRSLDYPSSQLSEESEMLTHMIARMNDTVVLSSHTLDSLNERLSVQSNKVAAIWSRLKCAIELAESRASEEIVSHSKKDSQAIKTIAIVTLLFLPGTFSATVFGLSSEPLSPAALHTSISLSVGLSFVLIIVWVSLVMAVSKGEPRSRKRLISYWIPCLPWSLRRKKRVCDADEEEVVESVPQAKSHNRRYSPLNDRSGYKIA